MSELPLPLPPGPKGHSLLGNATEFGRDVLGFLTRLSREYGDIAQFRVGPQKMVLLSRSEDIEDVLVTRPEQFRKPKSVRVTGRIIFGEALTASDGDRWLRQRRLAAPAFQKQRIDAYGDVVVRFAERAMTGWRDGETRSLDLDMKRLMNQILCKTLLDAELDGEADEIGEAITIALKAFGHRMRLGIPTPDWLPVSHNLRMKRGMERVYRLIDPIIRERRRSHTDRGDLLSMLISARDENDGSGMSDLQLRDEIAVMISVGGHQTSLALAWVLYLLSQHPEVEIRLHAELTSIFGDRPPASTDVPRLQYAAMVVNETLRLYPPFFMIGREALVDGQIGGYRIGGGTSLILSPWVTQRSPRYFDEPGSFRPDRWADDLARRLPRFAYFPFGGGPRVCIANAFVTTQLILVLATIAQRYRLELAPEHRVVPRPGVALGMRHGLRMIVRKRAAGADSAEGDLTA